MTNQISYILADDGELYRELTKHYLSLIPNLLCLAICENAIDANAKIQESFPDLLILDVEMPGLSGIQLAKSLKNLPLIIFISSHSSYASEAFEVDAIDYLVKPVAPERLMRAIDKARELLKMKQTIAKNEGFKPNTNDSFFIRENNAFTKILIADILYIESLGDFVNIYLQNGEKKIALVSLKNLDLQLPPAVFVRISRTHMINKEKITSFDSNTITLNKLQFNIGKTYTENVMQSVIENNLIKRFI